MALQQMQIGEVASRTGLSLRTIRYYEEMGLVVPSARSAGGFRLYTDSDVARLQVVMRMKPLDFSLEEMKDVMDTLDALSGEPSDAGDTREELLTRLRAHHEAAQARVVAVREKLAVAEGFAADLAAEIARHRTVPDTH